MSHKSVWYEWQDKDGNYVPLSEFEAAKEKLVKDFESQYRFVQVVSDSVPSGDALRSLNFCMVRDTSKGVIKYGNGIKEVLIDESQVKFVRDENN